MTSAGKPAPTRTIGAPGIAVVVAGAVLVMLSFTTVAWYGSRSRGADSVGSITFSALHHLTKVVPGAATSARAYFGWLGWALLLLAIVVGFAANLPTPAAGALRVVGMAIGLAGAATTYYALHAFFSPAAGGVFDHADAGVYLALAGFIVIGLGAAVGPLPARTRTGRAPAGRDG